MTLQAFLPKAVHVALSSYVERLGELILPSMGWEDRRTYLCFALAYFFYVTCAWVGIVVKNGAFSGLSGLEMEPLAKVMTLLWLLPITIFYNYLVNYLQDTRKLALIVLGSYTVIFTVIALLVTIKRFDPAVYSPVGGDSTRATLGVALFMAVDSLMSVVGSMFWSMLGSLVRFNHANSVYPVQVICGQFGALTGSFIYAQLGLSLGFMKLLVLMSILLVSTILLISLGFEMHDRANLALLTGTAEEEELQSLLREQVGGIAVVNIDTDDAMGVDGATLDDGIVGSPPSSPGRSFPSTTTTTSSSSSSSSNVFSSTNGDSHPSDAHSSALIPEELSIEIPSSGGHTSHSKYSGLKHTQKGVGRPETPSPMGSVANTPHGPPGRGKGMSRRRARLSSAGTEPSKGRTGLLEGLKLIISRKYVLCLAVISTFPQILNSVASYSMKLQAREVYDSPQLFAAFMANYGIGVNAMALLMASVGARLISRVWSLEKSITILPTVGIVISVVLYFKPSLALSFFIVIFLKASATSLNTSAREMLYLHCSSDIRIKSKSWIDMAGIRGAKGVSALFNICLVSYPSESYFFAPFIVVYFYTWLQSCFYLTGVSAKYAKGSKTYEIQ